MEAVCPGPCQIRLSKKIHTALLSNGSLASNVGKIWNTASPKSNPEITTVDQKVKAQNPEPPNKVKIPPIAPRT